MALKEGNLGIVQHLYEQDESLLSACDLDEREYHERIKTRARICLGANTRGMNALHLAILLNHENIPEGEGDDVYCDLLEYLLDLPNIKAILNSKWGMGNTALHLAGFLGEDGVVERLIELGADVNIKNHLDFYPLDVTNDPECLALLRKFQKGVDRKEPRFSMVYPGFDDQVSFYKDELSLYNRETSLDQLEKYEPSLSKIFETPIPSSDSLETRITIPQNESGGNEVSPMPAEGKREDVSSGQEDIQFSRLMELDGKLIPSVLEMEPSQEYDKGSSESDIEVSCVTDNPIFCDEKVHSIPENEQNADVITSSIVDEIQGTKLDSVFNGKEPDFLNSKKSTIDREPIKYPFDEGLTIVFPADNVKKTILDSPGDTLSRVDGSYLGSKDPIVIPKPHTRRFPEEPVSSVKVMSLPRGNQHHVANLIRDFNKISVDSLVSAPISPSTPKHSPTLPIQRRDSERKSSRKLRFEQSLQTFKSAEHQIEKNGVSLWAFSEEHM